MENERNIKVFLVDDDEVYGESLKKYLMEECFPTPEVKLFSVGEDCLNAMNEKPDIVFLDYYLNSKVPEAMNGLGILKQINAIDFRVPVVMLSSQDNIDIAVEMINNGAFDYVTKTESAFIRIKNMIEKTAVNIETGKELKKKVLFYRTINLIVIVLIILLFVISHYVI